MNEETREEAKTRDAEQLDRRRDPGPTGEEYERHRQRDRTRSVLGGTLLFLTFVLAILAVVNALNAPSRDDAITVCESNRESIRAAHQRDLNELETLRASQFPGFDPQDFRDRVRKKRRELEQLIADSNPDHCDDLFK